MKNWIRACAILLPCFTAAGLVAATTYTISVSANAAGVIKYKHDKRGKNGHQFVAAGDTIVWKCDSSGGGYSCTAVTVKFKGRAPCAGSVNPCNVNDLSDLTPFAYSIAVGYSGGGIAVDDPEVIVDNAGTLDTDIAPRKAAPKKK